MKQFFTSGRFIPWAIIVGLIIFLFQIDTCRNRDFQAQKAAMDSVTLANQKLVQDTNKLGQTVSTQAVIISTSQGDIKKLAEDNFNLTGKLNKRIKQVNALLQMKTTTGVTNVDVPFEEDEEWISSPADSALVGIPCDSLSYIHVPQKAIISDPFFKFNSTVTKKGIHIDSLQFPDSQRVVIVETKGGLLKRDINGKLKLYRRPTMEVMVLHTNPYVKTEGMSSVVYQPRVKGRWLERILVAAVTAVATYFVLRF